MFAKWKIYFKSKMKKEEWGVTNVLLWTAVLNEFDITEVELIAGTTKACFAKELKGWPPTTATDFIQVIRGNLDDSSYPDMRKAYDHAVDYAGRLFDDREDWQNVVVYETAQRIGLTKLATQREKMTWFDWQQVYPRVCDEHKAGAKFILPIDKSKQIENKHTPVQSDSPFNAELNEFFSKFGSKAV